MTAQPSPGDPIRDTLHRLEIKMDTYHQENRIGFLEQRAGLAELKNDVQELRSTLHTFWDAFSEFRNDYLGHGPHGEE